MKRVHVSSDVAVVEDDDAAVTDKPLPAVWNDNDEDEEVGWRIDTSAGSGKVDPVHDNYEDLDDEEVSQQAASATVDTKNHSGDRSMSKILRRKDKLPRCKMAAYLESMSTSSDDNANESSSNSLLEYMKSLSAPATDVELRSLCMFAEDDEGLQLLQVFLKWLTAQVSSGKDYEILQAYLHRTLTIYDKMLVNVPTLAEQLQKLKRANEQASDRFRDLIQKNLCMLKVLANISVL